VDRTRTTPKSNDDFNLGGNEDHDEMLGEGGLPQKADDDGAGDSETVRVYPPSNNRGIGLLVTGKGTASGTGNSKGPDDER